MHNNDRKQRQFEALCQKFDADTISDRECTKMTQLYYELHPEDIYWTDGRTPAQIWGRWASSQRFLSRHRTDLIFFTVVILTIFFLMYLLSVVPS